MRSVTVGIVCICGAAHLRRCLGALSEQLGAPPFKLVVAYDPRLRDVAALQKEYPRVRWIVDESQRTPLELASRAIESVSTDVVLLTEDHCIPNPDWVRRLWEAQRPDCAAVGGSVEVLPGTSPADWAFYFVDYYRYAGVLSSGPASALTVCNVCYQRDKLERIRPLWKDFFHETAVNSALRNRFGPLWLSPTAVVRTARHVRFFDAIRERYAFGRLFGCTRIQIAGRGWRMFYSAAAPALPLLLMGRMTRAAAARCQFYRPFIRALPALIALTLAWSWGEWIGYLTGRRPRSIAAAREIVDQAATQSVPDRSR